MSRKRPTANISALLGESAELLRQTHVPTTLPIKALKAGKGQPRREFGEARLQELAQSIREQGILQPLLVRPVGQGHEIVAGERRWRAAQLAGLEEVPVIVRELTDAEARQLALIENLQREDLNTVDEVDAKLDLVATTLDLDRETARARLMQLLREEAGEEHRKLEQVFASLGETWSSFTRNKLKILKWPQTILDAVRQGLPYSIAQIIVPAAQEHHPHLLTFAQAGASKKEMQEEVRRLTSSKPKHPKITQVGRVLASARFVARLDKGQQEAVEQWLSSMPDVLREALK